MGSTRGCNVRSGAQDPPYRWTSASACIRLLGQLNLATRNIEQLSTALPIAPSHSLGIMTALIGYPFEKSVHAVLIRLSVEAVSFDHRSEAGNVDLEVENHLFASSTLSCLENPYFSFEGIIDRVDRKP